MTFPRPYRMRRLDPVLHYGDEPRTYEQAVHDTGRDPLAELSDAHLRYDGPVPADQLRHVLYGDEICAEIAHCLNRMRAFQSLARSNVKAIRSLRELLADPALPDVRRSGLTDWLENAEADLRLYRKMHGSWAAYTRRLRIGDEAARASEEAA